MQDYATDNSTKSPHAVTGKNTTTRTIHAGQDAAKAHRNFRFLPWYSGAISEVRLDTVDVLTGPMSGCWLVLYRHGTTRYAGHLGTDIAAPAATAAVKASWNHFASTNPASVIGGFNPFDAWNTFPKPKTTLDGPGRVFGLYTTDEHFYAIFAFQQADPLTKFGTTTLRIVDVKRVRSASRTALQNL